MAKRAYKERFYPTSEQAILLAQSFSCVRFVWNNTLAYRTEAYQQREETVIHSAAEKRLVALKAEYPWLKDVSSVTVSRDRSGRYFISCLCDFTPEPLPITPKATRTLINKNQVICVESLNISGMVKNRSLASSKTCHGCGHQVKKLPLSQRHWHCEGCDYAIDRDVNAAKNIRTTGLAGLACGATGTGAVA